MAEHDERPYGEGDASLQAMGGEEGVAALVNAFYDEMERRPEAKRIRDMHPDLALAREKLTVFLVGWLGGPRRYAQRWGQIRIPPAHAHLPIGEAERDAWLLCMDTAIDGMPVRPDFRAYFKTPDPGARRPCGASLPRPPTRPVMTWSGSPC